VGALLGLGLVDEAQKFGTWMRDRIEEHVGSTSGPLKVMYRVDGTSRIVEEELPHLEGHAVRDRCGSATALPTSCSWISLVKR
jgi:GH15 family glucan-1,4-alpha-glucosidase